MQNITSKSNNGPENQSPRRTAVRRTRNALVTLGAASAMTLMSLGSAAAAPAPQADGPGVSDLVTQIVQQFQQDDDGQKQDEAERNGTPGKAPVETVQDRIIKAAQSELGTTETGGENCQKYSDQCVSWCALFAMDMWQAAGVDVNPEEFAFTGNVYEQGQEKGTAYGADALQEAKPGDVLLFGTGPSSPSTSKHIGIVEKVDGNQVTMIEGNSGDNTDSVVRKTHELSSETFYGGVHPW